MKKRVLSALLALCLTLSLAGAAFAENEPSGDSSSAVSQAVSSVESEPQTQDETVSSDSASGEDQTAAKTESTPAPTETPAASDVTEEESESTVAPEATEEPEVTAEPDATPTPTEDPVADVTENEESDGSVEYTASLETDGETMNVIVTAPEDAFAEGVQPKLSVTMLTAEDELNAVAGELDTAEVQYDGFAALDITFTDEATGEEVEPVKSVTVRIELPQTIVDSGVDLTTLAVQHLEEDENGNVQKVTEVATLDNGITLSEEAAEAVNEAAGVAPMSDMPAEEATAGDATETPAAVAEFEVDGFSSFVITWNNYYYSQITIHCVDESGKSVGDNLEDIDRSSTITMADIAPKISGYDYDRAVIARSNNQISSGREFTQLRYYNYRWQYKVNRDSTRWNDIYNSVYLVYKKAATEIETVPTVDSTAEGVHMYMFNYNYPAFSGGTYHDGQADQGATREGLASVTVNKNGWPTLTGKEETDRGTSFASFFGGADQNAYNLQGSLTNNGRAVNHLFLQSKYEEDGTFYYSSFDNFATLANDKDEDFTVYDALGTPDSSDSYFYQRGNFMPYNTLNTAVVANKNLYDEKGVQLPEEQAGDPVYALKENADYYFGMYVWADFYQPKDGKIESNDGTSNPMVFEFTGDDDMWVYIDGVLVLDLGGIHDAQSGSINFATGEITWTDTPTSDHTHPENYMGHSTLLQKYQKAGVDKNYSWDKDKPTFADGTNHRIQIFYMERGAGASNLKISFNLKTIPDGQLSIRKNVEHYYDPQLKDVTYTMQVKVNDEVYADQKYSILGTDIVDKTDSNGYLKLKHNQTALFADLNVNDKVVVKEVATSDTEQGVQISQNYKIAYSVTDGAGNTTGNVGTDGTVTATMPGYGSINVVVTNTATFTRPLKLVKKFSGTEGKTAPEGFEATYTLYTKEPSDPDLEDKWKTVGSIKYSDMEGGEYIFWLDTGKDYKVEETFESGDNKGDTGDQKWSAVTVNTNDPAEDTVSSKGIVYLDENDATEGDNIDTITLTNVYGQVKNDLSITKAVGADIEPGLVSNQTFTFTVTAGGDVNTELLSGTFQVTNGTSENISFQNAGNSYSAQVSIKGTGTLTIKELPIGTYTISEAQPEDLDDYYYVSNSLETGNDKAIVSATAAGRITVTNYYEPYKSLTLTKKIEGTGAVDTEQFTFSITGPEYMTLTDKSGKPVTLNEKTFSMKGGDSVTINKLKATDTLTINESDSKGYSVTIDLTKVAGYNSTAQNETEKHPGFTLSSNTVNVKVADVTEAAVKNNSLGEIIYINKKDIPAPTGLEDNHTKPFGLMVGVAVMAGLALAGGAVVRRRRRWME